MDWDRRVATVDAMEPLSERMMNILDEIDMECGEYMICVDADTRAVEEIGRALGRKAPKEMCERTHLVDGCRTTRRYETFNDRAVIPSGFGQSSGARQVVRLTTQTLEAQIEEKKYDQRLRNEGYKTILRVGIAFCGKSMKVGFEEVQGKAGSPAP